jgi:hypothetical protein
LKQLFIIYTSLWIRNYNIVITINNLQITTYEIAFGIPRNIKGRSLIIKLY